MATKTKSDAPDKWRRKLEKPAAVKIEELPPEAVARMGGKTMAISRFAHPGKSNEVVVRVSKR